MKKSLIFLIGIFSAFTGNTQISLTNANHGPVPGDYALIVAYDTSNAIPKHTGANQTWNFSNINLDSIGSYTINFVSPTYAPNGTTVTAEFGPGGPKRYFKNSSNKLDIKGFTSTGLTVEFDGDLLHRTWPMSYNTTISDTANGDYSMAPNPFIPIIGPIVVNSKSVVSGYGTLIAPNGATFNNVLQVVDSISFNIENLTPGIYETGVSVSFNSMSYYISNLKYPLLTYTKASQLSYAIDLQTFNIDYWLLDSSEVFEFNATPFSPLSDLMVGVNNHDLKLYPNPTTDVVFFETEKPGTLEIFSADGKRLETLQIQANNQIFSLQAYPQGLYIARFTDNEGNTIQHKLIRQ
ncbi:MAG: T9SS type A sorting domain-containing protein [Flavobacteriales bacterium]|nr:T9SS type A sorting domain-containing protein [Flavobacteriales bacterium]